MLLALSASCAEQTVPAQEILNRIAADEPANFDRVLISNYLDLSALPEAQVQVPLALVNCTIANSLLVRGQLRPRRLFWGTAFCNASFEKAIFSRQVDFSNATFGSASFFGCTFRQLARSGAGPRSLISWHGFPAAKE